MKQIYLLLMLTLLATTSLAQVETRQIKKGEMPSYLSDTALSNKEVINMPAFDMATVMNEEASRNNKRGLCRFGKAFDVSYTLSDGRWVDVKGGKLWTMSFASEDAVSLNFVFNDFHLSENASLYITNEDKSILYGPVTNEAVPENGFFLTDIIPGGKATIFLYEPSDSKEESTLTIKRVVHGFKDLQNNAMRSLRSNYTPDVACYPDFEKESDAVGLAISSDGVNYCSGSLVMSTDFSFKPYFLSTIDLVDRDENDEITQTEITNSENCLFKFRYKHESCDGETFTTSYTYNHATYRAAWEHTCFSLMEISGNLKQNPYLTWLGWNKLSNTPVCGTCIHHYESQEMRISFDHAGIDTHGTYTGNNFWGIYFDYGSYTVSSRGAPLLDYDKRVVGHMFGGIPYMRSCDFGKFYLSWSGGGTNASRLSNWLDPISTGQSTIDSYRAMVIKGPSKIISSATYSIQNLPSGATVNWSLSNSYYNQNCLSQNVPESNKCTITRSSSQEMSGATLTATITVSGSTICTITKTVSTGNGFEGTYYNGITTVTIDLPSPLYVLPSTSVVITSPNLIGATVSQVGGNATPTSWNFNNSTGILTVGMPSSSGMAVVLSVTCANGSTYTLPITTTDNGSGQLYVSQTGHTIEISIQNLNDEALSKRNDSYEIDNTKWKLEIFNAVTGERIVSKSISENSCSIETSDWKSGIYVIHANIGKESVNKKFIINK